MSGRFHGFGPRSCYSFQFWRPSESEQKFMSLGAFGQYLLIDRKRDFVVAQFATGPWFWDMLLGAGSTARPADERAEFLAVMRSLGEVAKR